MKKRIFCLSMLGLLLGVGWVLAQEVSYQVIVNDKNQVSSLPREQVSDMFLKKIDTWEDGTAVLPVDLVSRSPVREKFSREVHKKSVRMILNYWQKQIFAGRNVPPPWKMNDAEILGYVTANPGAIGYVSGDADVGKVKVIKIEE